MNNRDQSRETRAGTVANFLQDPKNAAEVASLVAFKDQAAVVVTANDNVVLKAAKANADNSGFSKIKLQAKQAMATEAATQAGVAYVHFENIGRHDLSADLLLNGYEYMALADPASAAAAQKVYDILNNNKTLLQPNYSSDTELAELATTITDFITAKGNTEKVHKTAPEDKLAFTLSLDKFDVELDNLLLIGRKLAKTNLDFYNKLVAAAKLPIINVHHTGLAGTVTKAGIAAIGAVVTVDGTNKKATTDITGKYIIKSIKAGTYTIKVTLATGETANQVVALTSGQILAVDFAL